MGDASRLLRVVGQHRVGHQRQVFVPQAAQSAPAGAPRPPAACRGAGAAAARGCRGWPGEEVDLALRVAAVQADAFAPRCRSPVQRHQATSCGACCRKVGRPGLGSVAWRPWMLMLVRCIRSTTSARYCASSSASSAAAAPRTQALVQPGTMAGPLGDFCSACVACASGSSAASPAWRATVGQISRKASSGSAAPAQLAQQPRVGDVGVQPAGVSTRQRFVHAVVEDVVDGVEAAVQPLAQRSVAQRVRRGRQRLAAGP
jgi:hypothetical protein